MSSREYERKVLLRQLSDGVNTLSALYPELICSFNALTSTVETRVLQSKQGTPQQTTDIIDTLTTLKRRGRILHVGGKCPCNRECSTFKLRRENQSSFEDARQSGLDVLDCLFRKVDKMKSISERLNIKLDTLSSQKQEVAEFVKKLSASITIIKKANKTANVQKLEAAKRKRVQQACTPPYGGGVATSSLTAQGGAASTHTSSLFAGKEGDGDDEEEDEEEQQPRKGKKNRKRVIDDDSSDEDE